MATSKTLVRTLDTDPEKPGPWKTWTLKKWILKNMDPEKRGKQLDVEERVEDHII